MYFYVKSFCSFFQILKRIMTILRVFSPPQEALSCFALRFRPSEFNYAHLHEQMGIYWNMGNLLMTIPLKKNDIPFPEPINCP